VTRETPPTFLFTTSADTAVPAENSVAFYLALHKAGCRLSCMCSREGRTASDWRWETRCWGEWGTLLRNWMLARGLLGGQ